MFKTFLVSRKLRGVIPKDTKRETRKVLAILSKYAIEGRSEEVHAISAACETAGMLMGISTAVSILQDPSKLPELLGDLTVLDGARSVREAAEHGPGDPHPLAPGRVTLPSDGPPAAS
jgi:hypothetical protein